MVVLEEQSEINQGKDINNERTLASAQDSPEEVLAVQENEQSGEHFISNSTIVKINDFPTDKMCSNSKISSEELESADNDSVQSSTPSSDKCLDIEKRDDTYHGCSESDSQNSVCLDIQSLAYLDDEVSDIESDSVRSPLPTEVECGTEAGRFSNMLWGSNKRALVRGHLSKCVPAQRPSAFPFVVHRLFGVCNIRRCRLPNTLL
ncbi:hypothetical protein JTE90_004107 [Oedothorax gibbosus]|uniref:Uncharacterized protein n=1 Tax=Oedothorax gibbosus TaxID=931172 RepID=A0AAV6V360_9ARAC|nr:hypothetical protein JTE90_004107 [Oedothorax gibbosus]